MEATYTKYGCTYGPKGNRIYNTEEQNEREAKRLLDACSRDICSNGTVHSGSSSVGTRSQLND